LEHVSDAVASQNPADLERAAHKLKGTVSIFGCRAAIEAAQALETMGRDQNLPQAEEVYLQLKTQIEALEEALSDLRQTTYSEP
jgi:HPt (histidine-containing phosphotransfer) domain-containing protein